MRPKWIVRAFACVLVLAGTSMLAAPEQTTRQPGQMTEAHVWVENRGRTEAVPVDLREINLDGPLKVQVINGEPQYAQASPVQVREIRKIWDYETITLTPTDDIAAVLTRRGQNGWETTGIAFAKPDGTTVLLKRWR
jgi:hypothetical protein